MEYTHSLAVFASDVWLSKCTAVVLNIPAQLGPIDPEVFALGGRADTERQVER